MNYADLLGVDSLATLNFFYGHLGERAPQAARQDEKIYVASILANYAQTSSSDSSSIPPQRDLSEYFDLFVFKSHQEADPDILEIAGAQSLFLAGFFADQMARRHNIEWYRSLGRNAYDRASGQVEDPHRKDLFCRIAFRFPDWARACAQTHRDLRDNRFLLYIQ